MGEIGRSHQEFMFDMRLWQLRMVISGYYKRTREMWSATRWQTYNLMAVSMADLQKAGIYKPTDLIRFQWEDENEDAGGGNQPTQAEIEKLQQMMREENAKLEQEQKAKQQ